MLATGCVLVRITIGTANKIDEISFRGRGAGRDWARYTNWNQAV